MRHHPSSRPLGTLARVERRQRQRQLAAWWWRHSESVFTVVVVTLSVAALGLLVARGIVK